MRAELKKKSTYINTDYFQKILHEMINNEITSWTQPVGSEIKGDKHGDSERTKDKQSRVYKSLINYRICPIRIEIIEAGMTYFLNKKV
jgi:hypothetical protein